MTNGDHRKFATGRWRLWFSVISRKTVQCEIILVTGIDKFTGKILSSLRKGIRTLCPLYSNCGRTLGLLCAWNRVAALVSLFVFCAFVHFLLCTFCSNSG